MLAKNHLVLFSLLANFQLLRRLGGDRKIFNASIK